MSNGDDPKDDKVGYRKPPKSGQFKKGVSGNPSGRPKKPSDFASELKKELQSKVIINENGKRKVITKSEIVAKQLANKAASGNLPAVRLVISIDRETQERAAEEQNSPNTRDYGSMSAEDLTDGELTWLIKNSPEYAALRDSPEYAALRDIDGRKANARSGSQE
jgi:hypothetical protein